MIIKIFNNNVFLELLTCKKCTFVWCAEKLSLHAQYIPEVTACSLCPAIWQKLSRVLQWTTVNVLIFDTGRLFPAHPDPTPLSLSVSLTVSLPLSLRVSRSDREQMLSHTTTTKPDTTTRTLPFCHLPLAKCILSLEDIYHQFHCSSWISSDTVRKEGKNYAAKAGFKSE